MIKAWDASISLRTKESERKRETESYKMGEKEIFRQRAKGKVKREKHEQYSINIIISN